MNAKEIKFCNEYLISGNATDAAIKAGYKGQTPKNASRWLDPNSTEKYKPELDAFIKEQIQKMSSQKIASAEEIMQYLTKGVRQELEEEVVMMDATGAIQRINKKISLRESNKCAELLAKRYGMLTDKVNLTVEPVTICNDLVE